LKAIIGAALLALFVLLAALAVWQRDTLRCIANPGRIQIGSAGEIRAALGRDGDMISYRALDGTVDINVALDGDSLQTLEARFNVRNIPVSRVADARREAYSILGPYLSRPEIRALVMLILLEIDASSENVEYSRPIGAHTLFVSGDAGTGEFIVMVEIS
jgi:hypothetical protein